MPERDPDSDNDGVLRESRTLVGAAGVPRAHPQTRKPQTCKPNPINVRPPQLDHPTEHAAAFFAKGCMAVP